MRRRLRSRATHDALASRPPAPSISPVVRNALAPRDREGNLLPIRWHYCIDVGALQCPSHRGSTGFIKRHFGDSTNPPFSRNQEARRSGVQSEPRPLHSLARPWAAAGARPSNENSDRLHAPGRVLALRVFRPPDPSLPSSEHPPKKRQSALPRPSSSSIRSRTGPPSGLLASTPMLPRPRPGLWKSRSTSVRRGISLQSV